MQNFVRRKWETLALLALALAGVALVLFNTRWGAYLSDDTYYYVYPAQDLLAGKGFNPSYIFGPMFPLALAGISLLGVDVLAAARWLNALLFGANIFLVGTIVQRLKMPRGFTLLAAGLVLLSDVVAEAHGWAMSEALGFFFLLLSLVFTLDYISRGKLRYWWGAAIAAGLAVLTRYASLPLAAAIGLALLVFPARKRFLLRLRDAALFGALSLAPLGLFWLRNQLTSGHAIRYTNFFNVPFTRDQLTWFMYNWFSLFVPGRLLRGREILAGGLILAVTLLAGAGLAWLYRKKWAQANAAGLFMLAAVFVLNLAMLYIARGFTQLDVFNTRYLVPILIVFLMLLVGIAGWLWQAGGRWARIGIAGFFAVFLVYYAVRTVDFSRQVYATGLGYSNVGWHNSGTVEYLDAHPEITSLVSTGEMGIYFWTKRMPVSLATYPTPQALKDALCQTNGYLVIMNQMPTEIYGMGHDDAVKDLELVKSFNDGQIFQCPQK